MQLSGKKYPDDPSRLLRFKIGLGKNCLWRQKVPTTGLAESW